MLDHMLEAIHELPDERAPQPPPQDEITEREIAELTEHVVGPNDQGWCDIFCHEGEENLCLKGTPRELAEKAYAEGWMVYHSNVLCRECQSL